MAMVDEPVAVAGIEAAPDQVTATLPEVGLQEIFQHWSGPGDLWDALAAVDDGEYRQDWTRAEIESRSNPTCSIGLSRRMPG